MIYFLLLLILSKWTLSKFSSNAESWMFNIKLFALRYTLFCELAIYKGKQCTWALILIGIDKNTYSTSDTLGSTDFSEFKVTRIHATSFTNFNGSFSFSLSLNNLLLTFLLGSFDEESCSLGFLLCNLLRFNSCCIFLSKTQFSQGDIIEDNVKVSCSFYKLFTDQKWYLKWTKSVKFKD